MAKRIPGLFLLATIPVLGVYAQQFGELRGTITDASGAVIVDASVTLTNVATQQVRAALSNEAGIYSAPAILPGIYNVRVEKAGFKELINITDMNFAFPNPALVAVGSIIRSKPDVINRFMRAYVRGMHRARTDPAFTYKSMAKYTKIEDTGVLQKAYEFYMSKVLENTPSINMVGVQNVLDDLVKTVPAAKNAKPEQFVDMRFLDTLEKSGLVKELYH